MGRDATNTETIFSYFCRANSDISVYLHISARLYDTSRLGRWGVTDMAQLHPSVGFPTKESSVHLMKPTMGQHTVTGEIHLLSMT